MVLSEVAVDIVAVEDEARFRDLMQAHHYLGAVPGMGETVRYVAHHRGRWLALAVFSAPALKCGARDRWIGWDYGVQFGRLHLVTNNSRFLILPGGERNLGSRVLSLCARRLVNDWPARFGHDLLLAETFVDPAYFRGTVYRAANWIEVGRTRGFARDGHSYSEHAHPKLVFLHPLCRGARARLRAAHLDPRLRHGVPKMTLSAARMRSLPEFFQDIDDPRRRQGRRHALPTVLALATAATLCGMRGYKAISEWVDDLSPKVLQRFRVRRRDGQHRPPSLSAMRSLLIRLASVLMHTVDWIFARSTSEVLLFVIWLYLARVAGYLSDIKRGVWGTIRAVKRIEVDTEEIGKAAHTIMTATEDIRTAAMESTGTIEEIRKVQAPRSYEIDRYD